MTQVFKRTRINAIAPSGIKSKQYPNLQAAMTLKDIKNGVTASATAARRAKEYPVMGVGGVYYVPFKKKSEQSNG